MIHESQSRAVLKQLERGTGTLRLDCSLSHETPFRPLLEFLVMPAGPAAPGDDDSFMSFRNELRVPVWATGPSHEGSGHPEPLG